MRAVNLIIVVNKTEDKVLMCHRQKDPYKGLYNFVGGKVEPDEIPLEAAYRELEEETGISKNQIEIKKLFFTQYDYENLELQVYYGFLEEDVKLIKEVNPLLWIDLTTDFSKDTFAGDGNIQHMIQTLKQWHQL